MIQRTNKEAIKFAKKYCELCNKYKFIIGPSSVFGIDVYDITLENREQGMTKEDGIKIVNRFLNCVMESAEHFEERYEK